MALPRDVFKAKMEEGRRNAAEKRAATLEQRKAEAMERAVNERMEDIKAQQEAYGGFVDHKGFHEVEEDGPYPGLSKPGLPPLADGNRSEDRQARNRSVPNVPRDQRDPDTEVQARNGLGGHAGPASECQLCRGFPWTTVPINVARDRFHWLTLEFQRVGRIITARESATSRSRGCSICGGHPQIPDHWYSVKTTIDKATGVEYTLYACSQPCYIDWPRKFPSMFGVVFRNNPTQ